MKAEECEEKAKHEGTSDSEKNKKEGNIDLDKSKLKAIARKNFDNILRSQIESRSSTINTEVNDVEKSSQLIRIENSKITKVQAIKSYSPSNLHGSLTTNNKNNEEEMVMPANRSKENTIFKDKTLQSIAAINLAFKPKDVDCQVFVYEPMYVNSSTLGSINPEKNYKSEKLLSAKGANSSLSDCLLNENTTIFKCYICPYYHVKEMMVARHMIQIHLSQNIYRCHYCSAQFLTNHLAYVHIQKMHENAEIKIDFKISDQISTQLGLAYKKKFYIQDGKAVSQSEVENVTTSQKSGSSVSVKCHKCGLFCKSVEELQEHSKLVHFRYRPYSCSLCNFSKVCFASKLDLDHHMKTTHPNELWVRSSISPPLPNNSGKKLECSVSINWSLVWGENIQTGNIMCEWCSYGTDSCRDMFIHASKEHNWSKSISCPTCKKTHALKPCHFIACQIVCSCNTTLNIQHEKNKSRVSWMENSYICKLCSHRAYTKSSIMRHLKYNHTACKPFNCTYCSYAAKEVSKIKTHILAIHPDKPVEISDREQSNEEIKKVLDDLFETHVQIEKQSFENATAVSNSSFSIKLAKNSLGGFQCGLCPYVSHNVYEVYSHARLVHEQFVKPERKNFVIPYGEHYRCVPCGYRCSDRSCMSRHAKYMHITSRPHSCPYCAYNNVEKTKVRLHVLSHHRDMPKVVKTNQRLLEEMSIEAKKFYVRVDEKGNEYMECKNGGIINVTKHSTSDLKKVDAIDGQNQNSFNEVVALREEPMDVENVKVQETHFVEFDDFKHPFEETLLDATAVTMNVEESNNVKHGDNLSQNSSAMMGNLPSSMIEGEDFSNMNNLSDEVLENFSENENEDVEMVADEDDNSFDFSSESDVNVGGDGDNDEEDSYFSSEGWDAVNKSLKHVEIVDFSNFLIKKETLKDDKISKMVPIVKLKDVNPKKNQRKFLPYERDNIFRRGKYYLTSIGFAAWLDSAWTFKPTFLGLDLNARNEWSLGKVNWNLPRSTYNHIKQHQKISEYVAPGMNDTSIKYCGDIIDPHKSWLGKVDSLPPIECN
ncbi:hypothetical protein HELRODRAFT_165479 [Helobdella robusta]|uniref:C2H2-type domain-containing protein n=1 Tax=Helobdella robusta TaxID=6412 RepID=T1EWV8_HELRO|nr:hypothetical protein HELRODRAFT_165479 [Helobdella robusta]ESN91445.1 hypothetical protein HELRODRAFT_165479 [Helobdella robusta]